jgi:phosphatidylglycerophosphate synthase
MNICSPVLLEAHLIYPLARQVAPIIHSVHVTPNMVTIFNTILRVVILTMIYRNEYSILTVALLWVSQFLDCLDGELARMYNQMSKVGHIIDHGSDYIFWSLAIAITSVRFSKIDRVVVAALFAYGANSVLLCEVHKECDYFCYSKIYGHLFVVYLSYIILR